MLFLAVAKDKQGSAVAGSGEGAVQAPGAGAGEGLGGPQSLPSNSHLPARAGLIALETADCWLLYRN